MEVQRKLNQYARQIALFFEASRTSMRTTCAYLSVFGALVLSKADDSSLLLGALVSFIGLALRIWTVGYAKAPDVFFVGGPYRFVRHPYYLGSFLYFLGIVVASQQAWVIAFYVGSQSLLNIYALKRREMRLFKNFEFEYQNYCRSVSSFFPQLIPLQLDSNHVHRTFSLRRALLGRQYLEALSFGAIILAFGLSYAAMVLRNPDWLKWILTGIFLAPAFYRMVKAWRKSNLKFFFLKKGSI